MVKLATEKFKNIKFLTNYNDFLLLLSFLLSNFFTFYKKSRKFPETQNDAWEFRQINPNF